MSTKIVIETLTSCLKTTNLLNLCILFDFFSLAAVLTLSGPYYLGPYKKDGQFIVTILGWQFLTPLFRQDVHT